MENSDVSGASSEFGLKGISAIPITPFSDDGRVDEKTLSEVVARMSAAGIDSVVACGNTSEYASLSRSEAQRVIATTIQAAGDVNTYVGVGGNVEKAAEEIRWAVAHGAIGVMIHSPSGPYMSDRGLIEYYGALARAADGPVVLYVREPEIPPKVLEHVAAIDNVIAIKYAIPDIMKFSRLVDRLSGAVIPICGLAEAWAPFFWLAGGRGFTSGLANVAPELSVKLRDALLANDIDKTWQSWHLIKPFEDLRARDKNALNVPAVKEAMAVRGYLHNTTVRAPISGLTSEERGEVAAIVSSWDAAQ
jgi:4-hydroxy-tetrahydrodipicolinate synthase